MPGASLSWRFVPILFSFNLCTLHTHGKQEPEEKRSQTNALKTEPVAKALGFCLFYLTLLWQPKWYSGELYIPEAAS